MEMSALYFMEDSTSLLPLLTYEEKISNNQHVKAKETRRSRDQCKMRAHTFSSQSLRHYKSLKNNTELMLLL